MSRNGKTEDGAQMKRRRTAFPIRPYNGGKRANTEKRARGLLNELLTCIR